MGSRLSLSWIVEILYGVLEVFTVFTGMTFVINQKQKEQWHHLYHEDGSQGTAKGVAPHRSPWFSGHFPENPILPGVAVLAMVKEAILYGEKKEGKKVEITGIKKVRFRLPVKPDDILNISYSLLRTEERRTYSFKVSLDGQVMCSGAMLARELINFCGTDLLREPLTFTINEEE